MADWKILPDGNLINLDEVGFIKVEKNIIFLKTSTYTYTVELDDEWREIIKELGTGESSNHYPPKPKGEFKA